MHGAQGKDNSAGQTEAPRAEHSPVTSSQAVAPVPSGNLSAEARTATIVPLPLPLPGQMPPSCAHAAYSYPDLSRLRAHPDLGQIL